MKLTHVAVANKHHDVAAFDKCDQGDHSIRMAVEFWVV